MAENKGQVKSKRKPFEGFNIREKREIRLQEERVNKTSKWKFSNSWGQEN